MNEEYVYTNEGCGKVCVIRNEVKSEGRRRLFLENLKKYK